jgi:hypothetical protein
MGNEKFYLAIDIGTGQGAKIALFSNVHEKRFESMLHRDEYGESYESFAEQLASRLVSFVTDSGESFSSIRSIGIACAGILRSDGGFQLVTNHTHFNGHNLKLFLEERFNLPVGIENDANAGGLAEWSVLRLELLYWVFGGGWGGAWITADGEVRFPVNDWDGIDSSLHHTNEPGYGIPLEKLVLKPLFHEVNASFELFERIVVDELNPADGVLTGPDGNANTIRAEVILSGPGRLRLFRTLVGDDDFYTRFLDTSEHDFVSDPSTAGQYIDKLSGMRVEAAVNTDRLYGKVLAKATRIMLKQAYGDGMPENLPVCLGGKPSYALPYFGPSTQRALHRLGIMNYLRPSVIDERGSNANLVGAAVLAESVWKADKA